jgi:hypothetical protein
MAFLGSSTRLMLDKHQRKDREDHHQHVGHLDTGGSIAAIPSASADIGVVFFHHSFVASFLFSLIFFPCTCTDNPDVTSHILIDFAAHGGSGILAIFQKFVFLHL